MDSGTRSTLKVTGKDSRNLLTVDYFNSKNNRDLFFEIQGGFILVLLELFKHIQKLHM